MQMPLLCLTIASKIEGNASAFVANIMTHKLIVTRKFLVNLSISEDNVCD